MKFTSGYVLGVVTIVSVEAAFVGGMFAYAWLNQQKNDKLDDMKEEDALAVLLRSMKKN